MTYMEALEEITKKIPDGKPVGSYEDKNNYYFGLVPKDEYDPKDKNKVYSSVNEFSVNKNTGEIKESDIIMYCTAFEPENLDRIKKSFKEID